MDSVGLQRYIDPVRRWWWLVLASALLAAGSAFVYVLRQPPLYQSYTTLAVGSTIQDPNPNGAEFNLAAMLAGSYAEIAQRNTFRNATMKALGIEWLPVHSVSVVPGTSLIEIVVTDIDPVRAQVVGTELVKQLTLLSPAGQSVRSSDAFAKAQMAKLQTNIEATEDEIARKKDDLAKELSASKIRQFEDQSQILESKLTSLQANYAALLSTTQKGAVNAINVLEPSSLPESPMDAGLLETVLLAALLGAALAIGCAYLIEFIDNTIRTTDQVSEELGVNALSIMPLLPETGAKQTKLIMLDEPYGPAAEAFRSLRANLRFASVDRPLALLQVASPGQGEGKSFVAANIAVAMAQAGQQVVLVDADLRSPTQHRLFGLSNNFGVTTALLGEYEALENLLQGTKAANLRVLVSGPLPPNPSELLGSRRMQDLFRELRSVCDVIIVDSPPITLVSDSAVIAGVADGVLLVIRAGKTQREAAKHAITTLHQVHAYLLGAVLNGVDEHDRAYRHAYQANYGYYHNKSQVAKSIQSPSTRQSAGIQRTEVMFMPTNGDGEFAQELARLPSSAQQNS